MCGIFGYIGHIDQAKAKKCLDTLAHRGPDGEGLRRYEGATLGHRRLSILDLSERSAQPFEYKDRYAITFNGEIYNFLELRNELQQLGYPFRSDGDTEVILAAYDAWGEKCLDRFNGMWAFGIWDKKDGSLFLSRDRFGKKPLFYTQIGTDIAFASEMKALAPLLATITANKELLRDIDHIFYYESTDRCLIEEIKRFPAGHWGRIKDGKLTLTRFWNTLDHLAEVPASYEDQVEKFKELFFDAVRIRMRADVTLGTALSGGLDSSAVISAMANIPHEGRVGKDWQHAFCASFPGSAIDEFAYAKEAADHLRVPIAQINIDPAAHIDKLDWYNYLFEDIYITSPIPFMDVYARMREAGVKVTLDGHGSDELFGGYHFDYLHILHDQLRKPAEAKEVLRTYFEGKAVPMNALERASFTAAQYAKNIAKHVVGRRNHSRDDNNPNWKKLDYFTEKLYISSHETVLPTLLRNYDRYSMAAGVEIRMPFMDHRLVTFALSLPWQSKIRDGFSKAIVRDAMAPFMPHSIAYRKAKVGFNSPTSEWVRGPLREFLHDTIHSQSFLNSDLIDAPKVAQKANDLLSHPHPDFFAGEDLWKSLSPFFWEQGFLKKIKQRT